MPRWYGPSWLYAEFAMCRNDPAPFETVLTGSDLLFLSFRRIQPTFDLGGT